MATTLRERLGDRHDRLIAVRLVLACLVVLGHAWPLTGADGPSLELLSDVAVNGFFVLSGYLIAESRVRTTLVPYLWRRFLRIYPAFLVSLLVVAVVLAPLAAALEGTSLDLGSAAGFVLSNADPRISQWGIDGTLTRVPAPDSCNGSLWTLFHEALAYGVHIDEYPVQQLLVLLGTASWGVAANSLLVVLLTLPLALLSWTLVEKPALRAKAWLDLRDRLDRRVPAPDAEDPSARAGQGQRPV